MNASERLHAGIKGHADETSTEGHWHTQPVVVEGTGGRLIISIMSAHEGNTDGVPQGIYAVTNVSPQDYHTYQNLRDFVQGHVTQTLSKIAGFEEPFELTVAQKTAGGSAVLRISPQILPPTSK